MPKSPNLTPLSDHVVVKRDTADEVTKGGIHLPDSSRKEKPARGKVLAVGPGKIQWTDQGWKTEPMPVIAGEIVLFSSYSGQEIELDGEKLTVLTASDICAIITGA